MLLVVGIVGLLALIALASRPSGPLPPATAASPGLSAVFVNVLVGAVLAVGLATLIMLAVVLRPARRRKRRPDEPPEWVYEPQPLDWTARLMLAALPLLLIAGVVAAFTLLSRMDEPPQPPPLASPADIVTDNPPPVATPPPTSGEPGAEIDWTAPAIAVGLLGAAAAALVLLDRRERGEPRPPPAVPVLHDALDDAIDKLRREPDPRRAVIAAYAAMERVLARGGYPRRFFEAPLEYLGRILRELRVADDAIERLTLLFERAKFSQHEIDAGMKQSALDALQRIRAELGGTVAEQPRP